MSKLRKSFTYNKDSKDVNEKVITKMDAFHSSENIKKVFLKQIEDEAKLDKSELL